MVTHPRESLGTSDGIAPGDWDAVEDLSASVYNALDTPEELDCRRDLLEFLDTLDRKYGPRPSLIAVRADFTMEDAHVRKQLYADAYALAAEFDDPRNLLFVCHSMCELCLETKAPVQELAAWMQRFRTHLDATPDASMEREYQEFLPRLTAE